MAQSDNTEAGTVAGTEEEPELPTMQKVAILFVALGQETAGEVMKFLSDYEIEEITQAVANLKNVSVEQQDRVMEEFEQHLLAGEWVSTGGIDFAPRCAGTGGGTAQGTGDPGSGRQHHLLGFLHAQERGPGADSSLHLPRASPDCWSHLIAAGSGAGRRHSQQPARAHAVGRGLPYRHHGEHHAGRPKGDRGSA